MKHLIKRTIVVVVALGIIGGAAAWYFQDEDGKAVPFRTAEVKRGDLLISISATGTVEPEEVVDVGAQVAGQIVSFGKDANGKTVDYGSVVKKGTVLARIDDSLYTADEAMAEAQVQSAKAGVEVAKANLEEMKAKFREAERNWLRAQKLGPSEALAQATYDSYQSAYETAKANLTVGRAAVLQAQASVTQARSSLKRAQRNLGYCTITSPVKGVIIDRRVNTGQTVVSSLNAPSLFLIAKDLKRMQVWVAVNEADIGKIYPGQPVTFTVDAFPSETFRGEVGKVRLNASMTQNVVTYTVEVLTDNSSGRLLPYLTANVQFQLDRHSGVLLVPNMALKWMPSVDEVAPEFRAESERPGGEKRGATKKAQVTGKASQGQAKSTLAVVWVPDGKYVRPLQVRTELSNGATTEVEGKGLSEGMEVVTGVQTGSVGQAGVRNPFTPRFRGSRSRKSK
jgi:HlyD family secretion protein